MNEITATTEAEPTFAKGTWQETLHKSAVLRVRGSKQTKQAGILLWTGAQDAINDWLPGSDTDVSGENLYDDVKDALGGNTRKGDASKVKTVALAVKQHNLVLAAYPNLSRAFTEADRLFKAVPQQAAEAEAAAKAIAGIEAPSTTGTVDGAAALLLSKGLDGAVKAILDALGKTNFPAHRAFMKEVSDEISGRVQAAKPKPAPKAPATPKGAAKPAGKAAIKTATTKPRATKAKPVAPAKQESTKAKPVPVQRAKGKPVSEPVTAGSEKVAAPSVPVKKVPVVVQR